MVTEYVVTMEERIYEIEGVHQVIMVAAEKCTQINQKIVDGMFDGGGMTTIKWRYCCWLLFNVEGVMTIIQTYIIYR